MVQVKLESITQFLILRGNKEPNLLFHSNGTFSCPCSMPSFCLYRSALQLCSRKKWGKGGEILGNTFTRTFLYANLFQVFFFSPSCVILHNLGPCFYFPFTNFGPCTYTLKTVASLILLHGLQVHHSSG